MAVSSIYILNSVISLEVDNLQTSNFKLIPCNCDLVNNFVCPEPSTNSCQNLVLNLCDSFLDYYGVPLDFVRYFNNVFTRSTIKNYSGAYPRYVSYSNGIYTTVYDYLITPNNYFGAFDKGFYPFESDSGVFLVYDGNILPKRFFNTVGVWANVVTVDYINLITKQGVYKQSHWSFRIRKDKRVLLFNPSLGLSDIISFDSFMNYLINNDSFALFDSLNYSMGNVDYIGRGSIFGDFEYTFCVCSKLNIMHNIFKELL